MFLKKKIFGEKKKSKPTEGWAVIVSKAYHPEVRTTLISKICDVFKMSSEEAGNIADNAPIILLDELTRPEAERTKEIFKYTGVEIYITDDAVNKTKCCRTVWPEAPNLEFLNSKSKEPEIQEKAAPEIEPENADTEKELALDDQGASIFDPTEEALVELAAKQSDGLDLKGIQEDYRVWKEKFEELKRHAEELRAEGQHVQADANDTYIKVSAKETEINDQKEMLSEVGKKYDDLKQSFSKFMAQFETELAAHVNKTEAVNANVVKLAEKVGSFEELKNNLALSFRNQKERFEKLQNEFIVTEKDFEEKVVKYSADLKQLKLNSAIFTKENNELRGAKDVIARLFEEQKKKVAGFETEHLKMRQEFDARLAQAEQEVQRWKTQAEMMTEKAETIENSRRTLESTLREQGAKLEHLEKEYKNALEVIERNKEAKSLGISPEWLARQKMMNDKLDALEKMQAQVISDLSKRLKQESHWEESIHSSIANLQKSQETLQKQLVGRGGRKSKKED